MTPEAAGTAVAAARRWRAGIPVALLLLVAGAQIARATTQGLSPWKGGGFGMFSTTDDAGRRYVRIFVRAPNRSEETTITPSLEEAAARAAVLPHARGLSALAQRVVERERRNNRPVDEVRVEAWRVEYAPVTLTATARVVRDLTYRVDTTSPPLR